MLSYPRIRFVATEHSRHAATTPCSRFPDTTNSIGHLTIGGCDAVDLVEQYGTPLYVLDETTLRSRCRQFASAFASRYPNAQAVYASKAYINPALARIFAEEG